MPPGGEFVYDFSLPLSKYNTLRYEDKTRQRWQDEGIGEFVRNDRFYCKKKPKTVKVTIRKTYEIPLDWAGFFCAFFTKTFSPKIKWDFCINCLLTKPAACGIIKVDQRAAHKRAAPKFRSGPHMQNFCSIQPTFIWPPIFPKVGILVQFYYWLIFLISFGTQPTALLCS